jgi:hypothetical protein
MAKQTRYFLRSSWSTRRSACKEYPSCQEQRGPPLETGEAVGAGKGGVSAAV